MSVFGEFVRKEFIHIFRDFRTLLLLFGIPAVQLFIFGYAIRTEIRDLKIGIIDKSKDNITEEITAKMASSGYFRIAGYYASEMEIEKAFQEGKAKQVVIFEDNFADKLEKDGTASVQIINDASNPNEARLANSYTSAVIADFTAGRIANSGSFVNAIGAESRMLFNPEMKSVYMFVPGLMAMLLMLISALMTSVSITREKEFGNMEILLASPLKPFIIIIGKVLPYIALAFINGIMILLMSKFVFEVPIQGNLFLLLLEMMLYILTSLSLGIFISTIARTQQAAMTISLVGLLMPTMMLSGFIYPVENMPYLLQLLSCILPARWFLIIIKGIMLKGSGLEYLWKETIILTAMMLFFIVVSIRKFKLRLE